MVQKDGPSGTLFAGIAVSAVMVVLCSVGGLLSWLKAPSAPEEGIQSAGNPKVCARSYLWI